MTPVTQKIIWHLDNFSELLGDSGAQKSRNAYFETKENRRESGAFLETSKMGYGAVVYKQRNEEDPVYGVRMLLARVKTLIQ